MVFLLNKEAIMEKLISSLLTILVALSSLSIVYADEESKNAITPNVSELSSFLYEGVLPFKENFEIGKYANELSFGNGIKIYSLHDGLIIDTEKTVFPVYYSNNGEMIGAIQVFYDFNHKIQYFYQETNLSELREVLEKSSAVMILSDEDGTAVIGDKIVLYFGNVHDDLEETAENITKERLTVITSNRYSANFSSNTLSYPSYHTVTGFNSSDLKKGMGSYNAICWAACMASVIKYHTHGTYSAEEIAGYSDYSKSMGEVRASLNNYYSVSTSASYTSSPSEITIMSNLCNDYPLLLGMRRASPNLGHMITIYGYSAGSNYFSVYYLDPLGSGAFYTSTVSAVSPITFTLPSLCSTTFYCESYLVTYN